MSRVASGGEPAPAAPGAARALPAGAAGQSGGRAPAGEAGHGREGTLQDRVREALAGLDDAELGAHPEAFEALSGAIVAELRSLEEL